MTHDLLGAINLLSDGLRADPLLGLASAVCWLDPLWRDDGEDADVPHDTDGILAAALGITRRAFPEVYVQAVQAIRQGEPYTDVDRLICEAVSARGIPLDGIEFMAYGIPLPAYGAALSDPDFYERHPDTLPVLACFGITPDSEVYAIDIPDRAYTTAQRIAADLEQQPDAGWQQIGWLLRWLFSCSGNSSVLCGIKSPLSSASRTDQPITIPDHAYQTAKLLATDLDEHTDVRYRQMAWLLRWLFSCTNNPCLDWDYETMCSVEPLSWDPDDVAYAVEIIAEADTLMADIQFALHWLQNTPVVLVGLALNVARLYQALEQDPQQPPRLTLHWPDPDHDTLDEVLHRIAISDGEIRVTCRSSAVPN